MSYPLRFPTRRASNSRPPPPPTTKSIFSKTTLPVSSDLPTVSNLTPPSPLSPPPSSPPRRRYTRSNLLVFRAASGEETHIHQPNPASLSPPSLPMEDAFNLAPDLVSIKPRISSVTASSRASSPQTTNPDFFHVPSEGYDHSVSNLKSHPNLPRVDYASRTFTDTDEEEIAPRRYTTLRATKNLLTQLRRKTVSLSTRRTERAENDEDEDEEQYNEIDEDEEDCESVYSHASAVNVDDVAHSNNENKPSMTRFLKRQATTARNIDKHGLPTNKPSTEVEDVAEDRANEKQMPPVTAAQIREIRELRRQSFASSFVRAREAKSRKAVVLAPPELQPHNCSRSLLERCVSAMSEALDMHMEYAADALERFEALSALFTPDERNVISEVMWEASLRTRHEAPVPWRTPLRPPLPNGKAKKERPSASASILRAQREARTPAGKKLFLRGRAQSSASNDTMLRSVVYGTHVIPGAQSAEGILLRMAGEYQREEMNRKASRAERLNVPCSFAMTLAGMIATFSRLECHVSYRKHRSRSATNRRGNPQALILLKTKYDGIRLSFAVTLHGDSPCTVLFRRPRVFSMRKIDEYATLVTEAKDILSEFGREVSASNKQN